MKHRNMSAVLMKMPLFKKIDRGTQNTTLVTERKREKFYRKERIRKRRDILRVIQKGSRYYSRQYTLIVDKNSLDIVRFAISIKKNVGNSAARNYEKRLCREFFRKKKHGFKKGCDVLIMVKRATKDYEKSINALNTLVQPIIL
jgi:ribonuclease P protein component